MNNRDIVLKLLEAVFFPILLCGQLFSFAGVGDSGALTISAPGFFAAPQTSSWGKSSLSFYSKMRSTRNNLPLQKLEDAKTLESVGAKIRKDCAVAVDGTVDCVVSDVQTKSPLGFFELERRDVWASLFLKEQDAADVQTVKSMVRAWSLSARNAFNECDLVYSGNVEERNTRYAENSCIFYGQNFAPSAVYHMALREIAPSKAVYALHHGREEKASGYTIRDLWAVRRYRDLETNTQILTWRSSLDKKTEIVAVAYASNDHVEPVPGAEGLRYYTKNKKLRRDFFAQERADSESKCAVEEKPAVEKTRGPISELPDSEDPDDENEVPDFPSSPEDRNYQEQLQRCKRYYTSYLRKFNKDKRAHVCQKKHLWENFVSDPLNNWETIVEYMVEVLIEGTESLRRDRTTFSKVKQINNQSVRVTYKKTGNKITHIADGWIEDEAIVAKFTGKRFV